MTKAATTTLLVFTAFAILASQAYDVRAQSACRGPRFWGQGVIPVYVSSDATNGLAQIGIPQLQTVDLVRSAVAMFSEQSGTARRLEYKGMWNGLWKDDAIVIHSSNVPDVGLAGTTHTLIGATNQIDYVQIKFYRKNAVGTTRTWQFTDDNPGDDDLDPEFVSVLIHEFGHAVADLIHPGSGGCPDTGQWSIMRPFGTYSVNHGLAFTDKFNLTEKLGNRSPGTLLYHRELVSGAWQPLSFFNVKILYRPATFSQNWNWNAFAFHVGPTNTIEQRKYRFLASQGLVHQEQVSYVNRISSSSIAIDTVGGGAIWVYTRIPSGMATHQICYKLSTDGGQTFPNPEVCPGYESGRDQFFAGYDPRRRVYIISWLNTGGRNATFYTIPAPGSPTPGPTWSQWYDEDMWFGPTIACKDAAWGCRVAYAATSTTQYCFKWVETEVDAFGAMKDVSDGAIIRSNCYTMQDTPSIVYNKIDDRFYRAFIQNNGASWAAYMTATGTTWTPLPDIYNVNVFHSAPTLGSEYSCFIGCGGKLRAWFTRY